MLQRPTIWWLLHFLLTLGSWRVLILRPKSDPHKKNHIWLVFSLETWKFDEGRMANLMYGRTIKSLQHGKHGFAWGGSTLFLVKPFASDEICSPLSRALVKLQACEYMCVCSCVWRHWFWEINNYWTANINILLDGWVTAQIAICCALSCFVNVSSTNTHVCMHMTVFSWCVCVCTLSLGTLSLYKYHWREDIPSPGQSLH